ncbi:BglG family transcription antiterminator LicT [Clostridium sp. DL1XJH146]
MIIEKILNNNVITTIDKENGLEKVVMGKGIAFGKKVGNGINEKQIEKVFTIEDKNVNMKFQQLVSEIPIEYFTISENIINYAKEQLRIKLDEHINIALVDHLYFAIKRAKMGMIIKNQLLWEIRRIYKKEFSIGNWAVEYINKELGVNLTEDEAGFIGLHLINASVYGKMSTTIDITSIIKDVFNIIKYNLVIEIDEDDMAYDRLVTHLKFFAHRVLMNKQIKDKHKDILDVIKSNYQKEYLCALKISDYINKRYDYVVEEGEIVYLSMHLSRLMDY